MNVSVTTGLLIAADS